MLRQRRSGQQLAKSFLKRSYFRARYSATTSKSIALIMGVQRSGTGALVKAFENDWNCKTYGEDGGLALGSGAGPHMRWRWKPYQEVARLLQMERAPLLVAKPLVESQHAEVILEHIPQAKIIWAFRDYRDVALSGQQHFGSDRIKLNLGMILNRRGHWYSENVDEATRNLVAEYYRDDRPIYDLRALGWYVRNSLVLRYEHLPVIYSDYDDLAKDPNRAMSRLYAFLGRPYPGDYIVRHIHPESVKRGREVGISKDIRDLCERMLRYLRDKSI
jgi:hypothetical protein